MIKEGYKWLYHLHGAPSFTPRTQKKKIEPDEIQHYGNKNSGRYRRGSTNNDRVFISGTSKIHSKTDGYYRKKLPKPVKKQIDQLRKKGATILVGDAPGVDTMVQKHLYKKGYKNVEVYASGPSVRTNLDSGKKIGWNVNHVDTGSHQEMSKQWLAAKDKEMSKRATSGIAIILEEGSSATRRNVKRLLSAEKDVSVFQLNADGNDHWEDPKAALIKRK